MEAEAAEHYAKCAATAAEWSLYGFIGLYVFQGLRSLKSTKRDIEKAKTELQDAAIFILLGPFVYMEAKVVADMSDKAAKTWDMFVQHYKDRIGSSVVQDSSMKTFEEAKTRWGRWDISMNDNIWLLNGKWIEQTPENPYPDSPYKGGFRLTKQYSDWERRYLDETTPFHLIGVWEAGMAAVGAVLASRALLSRVHVSP